MVDSLSSPAAFRIEPRIFSQSLTPFFQTRRSLGRNLLLLSGGNLSNLMLKITIADTPTEHRMILVGKLVGPWIAELRKVWEQSRQQLGNRSPVIDLNDVTTIDDGADSLLATMLKEGAELVASGMVNRWLIEALKEGRTRVSVRALYPSTVGFSHTVDLDSKEVTTIVDGAITLAEVRAHLLHERHDSALPYRELIDARQAVVRLSSAEVKKILELLRSLSRKHRLGRTAVVVSTEVAYGSLRMLQILVDDVCVVQPFLDLPTAERWLRG